MDPVGDGGKVGEVSSVVAHDVIVETEDTMRYPASVRALESKYP